MDPASITSHSPTQSTRPKKPQTNWILSPKSIIPRPVRKPPSLRMIQRFPSSNDFSLSDPNFDYSWVGSESDADCDEDPSLQDGFKAVDKTKRGFELSRSSPDPALQEKILEMRRSRSRRATTHMTNTNTILELDLHKKMNSTFPEKDDSRLQLPVDFSSSFPSFVQNDVEGLSLPAASVLSASKKKSDGGFLERKPTRRKRRSSTKRGFELSRPSPDPALQEKILEIRRSRSRRATTHMTNTNTMLELDLHKKINSTFPEKDDSRQQLPVDFSSSLPSFVQNDLEGLSLPPAASLSSASEKKSFGGLLERKLTRRKGRSSTKASSVLCKDYSCLSFDTKSTLGSTDVDDDNESINDVVEEEMLNARSLSSEFQNESLPALPAALKRIDEFFSERSTPTPSTEFLNPWKGMEHSAALLKSKEEAMEKLRQELANSQQDADALRTRLSASLQELARVSEQQHRDQQLSSNTSTQLRQLKLDHADSMSQKLAYKKEAERLNSQLDKKTFQGRDMPTQLEQANITFTSLAEELKAVQKQLAAQQEEMTLTHGTLKRKRLDKQRAKKLDEREEQLNQRDVQLIREQEACLDQLRLAEEQGEQKEAIQTQIKARDGMQNETLQKKNELLEFQIEEHRQLVAEWQERERSASSRGKQLDRKEVTLRNQDSKLKRRKIILESQARQREREHHNAVDKLQARVDTFDKANDEFRRTKSPCARQGVTANSHILQAKDSELATLKQKVQQLQNIVVLHKQHGDEMLQGKEGEELLNDERGFNLEQAEEISQLKKGNNMLKIKLKRCGRDQDKAMSKQRNAIMERLELDSERNELGGETSSADYSFLLKELKPLMKENKKVRSEMDLVTDSMRSLQCSQHSIQQ